jgi:hypothetical protein
MPWNGCGTASARLSPDFLHAPARYPILLGDSVVVHGATSVYHVGVVEAGETH